MIIIEMWITQYFRDTFQWSLICKLFAYLVQMFQIIKFNSTKPTLAKRIWTNFKKKIFYIRFRGFILK